MSQSYNVSDSLSFSVTHARHIAAKVATDLKRMQRLYGEPSDADITSYEKEMIDLLKAGYLEVVTYGFWRNGDWIEPTLRFTAQQLSSIDALDDDPGRVVAGANIANSSFYSYLTYSSAWHKLSDSQRVTFKNALPFFRGGAAAPGVNGYFTNDRTYSAGGRGVSRASVRSW